MTPKTRKDPGVRPLAIGSVLLKNNLVMAPMAGITDMPFRSLAREGGAGLVCTEMLSAAALVHRDEKTFSMLALAPGEHPVSVQIFGSQPRAMAEAAMIVQDRGADIIDINFGCPVRKVMKSGSGVKAVENEKNMAALMESVVKSVTVPVTIKIRIGIRPDENIAPRVIELAEQSGIQAVVIHGRPAASLHRGDPDLAAVAVAVESARIPVIGNGGIVDELSAKNFLEATGCDGLMIGRGAIGDMRIFQRIEHFLSTGEILFSPSWEYRVDLLKRHAKLSVEHYGEKNGLLRLRKIAPYYLKGLPHASSVRNKFNRITALNELDGLLSEIWKSPYFEDVHSAEKEAS